MRCGGLAIWVDKMPDLVGILERMQDDKLGRKATAISELDSSIGVCSDGVFFLFAVK